MKLPEGHRQVFCRFPIEAAPLAYQVAAALGDLELEVAVIRSQTTENAVEVYGW